MMLNLTDFKDSYNELYNDLITFECKVSYNGKVIYEGKYDENYDYGKKNKSCIVVEFKLGESGKGLFTLERNTAIDELKTLMEGKKFEDIMNDASLYNKAMNISNKLPLYGIMTESNTSVETMKFIKKSGSNMQKIYENMPMF